MNKPDYIEWDNPNSNLDYIINLLPEWKTKIISVTKDKDFVLRFFIAAKTAEDVKLWLEQFQEKNYTTYSVKCTKPSSGRYVLFKQRLYCYYKDVRKPNADSLPSRKHRINRNCTSTITVTIKECKKRYQGSNKKYAPDPEMPCEIVLNATHNHPIMSADALRFRKVSEDTKNKLLELYTKGHKPATALETLKMNIHLENDNPSSMLSDRSICPDYNYCYKLYRRELKKQHELHVFGTARKEFLEKRINEYNESTGDLSSKILFHGADYIISICPPLFRRIHERISAAAELVFVDSINTLGPHGSKVFILSTHSECGGLPLGIIITSSESEEILTIAFGLFKDIVGNIIFGGYTDGPKIFLTDNSRSETAALINVWKKSMCHLSTYHVLRSVWQYVTKKSNDGIPPNKQILFYEKFRNILNALTYTECEDNYNIAKYEARDYPNLLKYLEDYWNQIELWGICFRNTLLNKENDTNDFSEAAMRLFKDKLFERVKAFNITQMFDFLTTKFTHYYELLLLDAANNRMRNNILHKNIKETPSELIEKIQILSENIVLVPSGSTNNLNYLVNIEALSCSCFFKGNICKHIDWAYSALPDKLYNKTINLYIQNNFNYIATGTEAPCDGTTHMPVQFEESDDIFDNVEVNIDENVNERNEICLEESLLKGTQALEDIYSKLYKFLSDSPENVTPALQLFSDSLDDINSRALVSSLSNFPTSKNT